MTTIHFPFVVIAYAPSGMESDYSDIVINDESMTFEAAEPAMTVEDAYVIEACMRHKFKDKCQYLVMHIGPVAFLHNLMTGLKA